MRIRKKLYPAQNFDGGSLKDAHAAAARIEAGHRTGLFVDYTSSHRISYAELIERYTRYRDRAYQAFVGISVPVRHITGIESVPCLN